MEIEKACNFCSTKEFSYLKVPKIFLITGSHKQRYLIGGAYLTNFFHNQTYGRPSIPGLRSIMDEWLDGHLLSNARLDILLL